MSFLAFILEDLYTIISKHTNLHANLYHAGEGGSRIWKPIIPGDIKTFVAAIFYMGIWDGLPY